MSIDFLYRLLYDISGKVNKMIINNLSVLLAERNLKITKVSRDTEISRTTLTALTNNRSSGMQLDTLNTLCNYLHVNPGDILLYAPIDILFHCTFAEHSNEETGEMLISTRVLEPSKAYLVEFVGSYNVKTHHQEGGTIGEIVYSIVLSEKYSDNETQFLKSFLKLSPLFRAYVNACLESSILNAFDRLESTYWGITATPSDLTLEKYILSLKE